ncbi:MAG TPA: SDR family oxidoreductase [Candidatus Avidesulfovibrio excrementigallinarum]|nr:SDR family oxidoreductase [Candidatus Avidesulfovibrio excrementigallinarum]
MATLLVLGGGSAIGMAVAERFAQRGWTVILAGRGAERMAALASALASKTGCEAFGVHLDVLDMDGHATFWQALPRRPEAVLCAVGLLGNAQTARDDAEYAERLLRVNFNGPARLLELAASEFERRGAGLIIGISSVAGDRGRSANYLYGSAKAGLTALLSGLHARLWRSGVQVLTVKPGLVDTPMIAGRTLPRWLIATPERVAGDIMNAVDHGRAVLYTPRWWRVIMWVVRLLPECWFRRISV